MRARSLLPAFSSAPRSPYRRALGDAVARRGVAGGALFAPAGEPPLIIGAFRVTGGEQRLYTVLRFPLPGTKQRLYLEGVGVMKPLTPAEFARITSTLRAAGFRWDPNLPYAPPFQLWWGHKGRPESTAAPSTPSLPPECLPEVAQPEVPEPLRFVYEDVEYGKRGSRTCARFYVPLKRLIQYGHEVREFPTLKVVAHAPGAGRHPERLNIPAPTRWVIGTAPDGSRLIVLALHDPVSDLDRVVDLLELPAGTAYGEWIGVHFERWYPGAGEEIKLALAAAEGRAGWPFASPEATTAPSGETPGASETSAIFETTSSDVAPPAPEVQEPRAPDSTPGAAPENSRECSQPEPAGAEIGSAPAAAPEKPGPRAPPGPAAESGEGRGQWTLDRWLSGEGVGV